MHKAASPTSPSTSADTGAVVTTNDGQPNLAIVRLLREGLTVRSVSAQMEPELLGWSALSNNKNSPTTSVTHTLEGPGTRYLLTLRPGQGSPVQDVRPVSGGADVTLAGGRRLQIRIAQEGAPGRLDSAGDDRGSDSPAVSEDRTRHRSPPVFRRAVLHNVGFESDSTKRT